MAGAKKIVVTLSRASLVALAMYITATLVSFWIARNSSESIMHVLFDLTYLIRNADMLTGLRVTSYSCSFLLGVIAKIIKKRA